VLADESDFLEIIITQLDDAAISSGEQKQQKQEMTVAGHV
jgi:hypothetical protein